MYIYMYIHIHLYITYTYTYTHTFTHTHTHTHTHSVNSGAMQIPSTSVAINNFQNHSCCGRRRECRWWWARGGRMEIASHELCLRSVSLHGPVCVRMCVPLCVYPVCALLCVNHCECAHTTTSSPR